MRTTAISRHDGGTSRPAFSDEHRFAVMAAVLGFLGVLAGAFGAHALEARIQADLLEAFETGARYHLVHALALLGVALALGRWPDVWVGRAGWLFVAGVVLFSGSLYALALTDVSWLGAITPLGGAAFLAGWLALGLGVMRSARSRLP